ncbi:DJ-1/PfpI family protein [uncultured Ruthenibacterium sp.]|uniref:DJ-1/PfpI family protein n=1 Tax=uncultured Ruthenibacterium sp. TaxID=1905347 RepID=UPI00349ECDD9
MKKAAMFVTDGFEEIEAVGTFAILRRGGVQVDVYSLLDKDATGRFGLTCTNLKPLSSFLDESYDALILPGGPEYQAMEASQAVQNHIGAFWKTGRLVCAICAAPTILGHAGYLKGKHYTCFTSMNEDFGGVYHEQYAVRDENLITGRSAAATVDFAFLILEALEGLEKVEEIKAQIYYEK